MYGEQVLSAPPGEFIAGRIDHALPSYPAVYLFDTYSDLSKTFELSSLWSSKLERRPGRAPPDSTSAPPDSTSAPSKSMTCCFGDIIGFVDSSSVFLSWST